MSLLSKIDAILAPPATVQQQAECEQRLQAMTVREQYRLLRMWARQYRLYRRDTLRAMLDAS